MSYWINPLGRKHLINRKVRCLKCGSLCVSVLEICKGCQWEILKEWALKRITERQEREQGTE